MLQKQVSFRPKKSSLSIVIVDLSHCNYKWKNEKLTIVNYSLTIIILYVCATFRGRSRGLLLWPIKKSESVIYYL